MQTTVTVAKCASCGDAEHLPNQCKRDNCGESEVCHRTDMAGQYLATDAQGRPHTGTGNYRVFPARGEGWRE